MTSHCPDCGVALEIRKAGGVSKSTLSFWDRLRRPSQKQTRYHQDAPWIAAPTRGAPLPQVSLERGEERELKQYRPKTIHDLAPAFAWGLTLSIPTSAIAGIAGLSRDWALGIGGGLFVAAFLAASIPVMFNGKPDLIAFFEKMTRTDIDGDGVVGKPVRKVIPIRLDIIDGRHHRLLDIDITDDLQAFAQAVVDGKTTFAETGAGDFGLHGKRKEEFIALRDALLDRGVIRWKNVENPRSGYDFLRGFDEAMIEVASYPLDDE